MRRRYRTRGESPPLSSRSVAAAPGSFFPHDDLENADRRANLLQSLLQRTPRATAYQGRVHQGVPRRFVARPVRFKSPVFLPLVAPRGPRARRGGERLPFRLTLPLRVEACVRRTQRREALFALRKIGFAGSSPGRGSRFTGKWYRRTGDSNYACV